MGAARDVRHVVDHLGKRVVDEGAELPFVVMIGARRTACQAVRIRSSVRLVFNSRKEVIPCRVS